MIMSCSTGGGEVEWGNVMEPGISMAWGLENQLATYLAQKRTRVCVRLGQMPTHKTCHKSTGSV